jgi:hypothetical protein
MESKGVIRKIFEEEGSLLVSFPTHDGYFQVPLAEKDLCAKIKEARDAKKEISFTFDRELRILSVR